jgi:hypothetical protein
MLTSSSACEAPTSGHAAQAHGVVALARPAANAGLPWSGSQVLIACGYGIPRARTGSPDGSALLDPQILPRGPAGPGVVGPTEVAAAHAHLGRHLADGAESTGPEQLTGSDKPALP